MKRGRIALFVPSLRGGGAELVMVNLARGFLQRGFSVDLVVAKAEGPHLRQVPAETRIIDLKRRRVSRAFPALVRYFRSEQPEVLLSTLTHANVVALLARRIARAPTRVVVREANALFPNTRRGRLPGTSRLVSELILLLMRRLYASADAVVAVSDGVARDVALATGLPLEHIRTIANPVVTAELLERANERVDHPWFQSGQIPVVLGVGRLTEQKDFPTLIRAFARIRERRPCRLVILGEGTERPLLEKLVTELGLQDVVAFPGFIRNPYRYMNKAAVFVLSSAWEGLPGVLIQALACGTAVVATDCGSGTREILSGGELGRLVPPADDSALAAAVLETLDEPRKVVRREALTRFSQEVAVDLYLRLLVTEAHE